MASVKQGSMSSSKSSEHTSISNDANFLNPIGAQRNSMILALGPLHSRSQTVGKKHQFPTGVPPSFGCGLEDTDFSNRISLLYLKSRRSSILVHGMIFVYMRVCP